MRSCVSEHGMGICGSPIFLRKIWPNVFKYLHIHTGRKPRLTWSHYTTDIYRSGIHTAGNTGLWLRFSGNLETISSSFVVLIKLVMHGEYLFIYFIIYFNSDSDNFIKPTRGNLFSKYFFTWWRSENWNIIFLKWSYCKLRTACENSITPTAVFCEKLKVFTSLDS